MGLVGQLARVTIDRDNVTGLPRTQSCRQTRRCVFAFCCRCGRTYARQTLAQQPQKPARMRGLYILRGPLIRLGRQSAKLGERAAARPRYDQRSRCQIRHRLWPQVLWRPDHAQRATNELTAIMFCEYNNLAHADFLSSA